MTQQPHNPPEQPPTDSRPVGSHPVGTKKKPPGCLKWLLIGLIALALLTVIVAIVQGSDGEPTPIGASEVSTPPSASSESTLPRTPDDCSPIAGGYDPEVQAIFDGVTLPDRAQVFGATVRDSTSSPGMERVFIAVCSPMSGPKATVEVASAIGRVLSDSPLAPRIFELVVANKGIDPTLDHAELTVGSFQVVPWSAGDDVVQVFWDEG